MIQSPVLPSVAYRIETPSGAVLNGVGNAALLADPLLGFLASRECPGHVLLETLDRVPEWIKAGRVIVSGFHSPLEQQVLRSALRRKGRVVKVLARGMTDYRPTAEEREPLAAGRMLIITACPPEVRRTTRETALTRNRLVLALATEIVASYISSDSPLAELLIERRRSEVTERTNRMFRIPQNIPRGIFSSGAVRAPLTIRYPPVPAVNAVATTSSSRPSAFQ